jgi:hypothetical protein
MALTGFNDQTAPRHGPLAQALTSPENEHASEDNDRAVTMVEDVPQHNDTNDTNDTDDEVKLGIGMVPTEMFHPFHSQDKRWMDGCVEVEPGWLVSVIDATSGDAEVLTHISSGDTQVVTHNWCTVRVNGVVGRVPADVLKQQRPPSPVRQHGGWRNLASVVKDKLRQTGSPSTP